jgi:hypothetical protein
VKRLCLLFVGAIALMMSVGVGELHAQPALPGAGPPQPTYSPYLNLLRPGGTPAQNYYQLVSPELYARGNLYNLQNQITTNQQSITNLRNEVAELGSTGHTAQFMNYRSYFMTSGGGGRGK